MASESLNTLLAQRCDIISGHARNCQFARLALCRFIECEDDFTERWKDIWQQINSALSAAKRQEAELLDLEDYISLTETLAYPPLRLNKLITGKFKNYWRLLNRVMAIMERRMDRIRQAQYEIRSRPGPSDAGAELLRLADEEAWIRQLKRNCEILMFEVKSVSA